MTIDVVDQQNKKIGSLDLRDEVFGGRVKVDLIHESVVHANAADRRGTASAKTRAEVQGSGKKPWRQKGTGRARVRDIRNPLWRKGGTVFGPRPRSYDFHLSRKVEKGALRAALTQKLREGTVIVVDKLSLEEIRTKAAVDMLHDIYSKDGIKDFLTSLLFIDGAMLLTHSLNNWHIIPIDIVASRNWCKIRSFLIVVFITELGKLFPHTFW